MGKLDKAEVMFIGYSEYVLLTVKRIDLWQVLLLLYKDPLRFGSIIPVS